LSELEQVVSEPMSSAVLVAQLEVLAATSGSALKSGPLANLQSIKEVQAAACPPDKFNVCSDKTCMPKSNVDGVPSGGQCCTYDSKTNKNQHCPSSTATTYDASLKKCVSANNAWKCTAPGATHSSVARTAMWNVPLALAAFLVAAFWSVSE
jgi:hypothetical protein